MIERWWPSSLPLALCAPLYSQRTNLTWGIRELLFKSIVAELRVWPHCKAIAMLHLWCLVSPYGTGTLSTWQNNEVTIQKYIDKLGPNCSMHSVYIQYMQTQQLSLPSWRPCTEYTAVRHSHCLSWNPGHFKQNGCVYITASHPLEVLPEAGHPGWIRRTGPPSPPVW